MRNSLLLVLLTAVSLPLFLSTGCGSGDKPATPQQIEEHRQKHIQNAERERREG
jgi:hypothetical protein